MTKPLDNLVFCAEHECPMIRIGDEYHCAFEYTDDLIGAEQVVDVIFFEGEEPARLVFSNGYTMPLLCACCGEKLMFTDTATFHEGAVGLYLNALTYDPDGSGESIRFVFAPTLPSDELAGDELPDGHQLLDVHLDSVRQIERSQEDVSGSL